MSFEQNPIDALNAIKAAREQALAKMDYWPWWYDAGYALACGLLVAGQGVPNPYSLICMAVALGVMLVIMRKWKAETGVWVNGYSPKRARWAAFGLGVVLMALMAVSIHFGRLNETYWVPVVCGLVAAVLGCAGMRVWMKLYRIDVRSL